MTQDLMNLVQCTNDIHKINQQHLNESTEECLFKSIQSKSNDQILQAFVSTIKRASNLNCRQK